MSYQIYHTEGIVIGIKNRGEANRVITILTRDLGLVRASAQSIRKVESKLRFGTQQLSHCHCDFVLGKEYWRIIGVEPIQTGNELVVHTGLWNVWNRCAALLLRLIPTDEPHVELYDAIHDAYIFSIQHADSLDPASFEHFLVLRILTHLGYWSVANDEENDLLHQPLTKDLFDKKQDFLRGYTRAINEAIKGSDL